MNSEIEDQNNGNDFEKIEFKPNDDSNKLASKSNSQLRTKLIENLKQFNQILSYRSIGDRTKIDLIMENNQLASSLISLSDKDEIDENKDVVVANLIGPEGTNDIKLEKEDGHGANKVQYKTKNEHLDSLKKFEFFEQIDYMLDKVKKFDNHTNGNINSWFFKYEAYCDYFGWSNNQRISGLIYLFDSSVMKITSARLNCSNLNVSNYMKVKYDLISFANELLILESPRSLESKLIIIMKEFDQLEFTNYEKNFWLNCFLPSHKLLELCNNSTENFEKYMHYLF